MELIDFGGLPAHRSDAALTVEGAGLVEAVTSLEELDSINAQLYFYYLESKNAAVMVLYFVNLSKGVWDNRAFASKHQRH